VDDGAGVSEGEDGDLETIRSVSGLSFSVPCVTFVVRIIRRSIRYGNIRVRRGKTLKKGQERERSIIQKKGKVHITE
jgi:hypothetical protein